MLKALEKFLYLFENYNLQASFGRRCKAPDMQL